MSVLRSYKNITIVFLYGEREKQQQKKTSVHMCLNLKNTNNIEVVPGACVCTPKGNLVYCVIISHSL